MLATVALGILKKEVERILEKYIFEIFKRGLQADCGLFEIGVLQLRACLHLQICSSKGGAAAVLSEVATYIGIGTPLPQEAVAILTGKSTHLSNIVVLTQI